MLSLTAVGPVAVSAAAESASQTAQPDEPTATQEVERRPEFSLKLPELRAGPFDFKPRLTTSAVYDDNILIASRDEQSDLIWSVQPAVQVLAGDRSTMTEYRLLGYDTMQLAPGTFITQPVEGWPGKMLMLDYGPKFNWFTEHSANDSVDHIGSFNALWPMAKAILGFQQEYRLESTTIIEAGQRSQQETITTALLAGYQISEKTSAELNLRRRGMDYEAKNLTGYTDWSNDNWFNYQMTPLLNVGAGVTWGLIEAGGQSQSYEQILARSRYRLAERVGVGLSVGCEFRQFKGNLNKLEPVFSLDSTYRPFDGTVIYVAGYRRDQISVYYGYNYILTGVTLGGRQRYWDRYFLSVGAAYDVYDYLASSQLNTTERNDRFLSTRLGIEAQWTKRFESGLFYTYRTVDSDRWDGFANHQAEVRLTLKY